LSSSESVPKVYERLERTVSNVPVYVSSFELMTVLLIVVLKDVFREIVIDREFMRQFIRMVAMNVIDPGKTTGAVILVARDMEATHSIIARARKDTLAI